MSEWQKNFVKCIAINLWAPQWDEESLTQFNIEHVAQSCANAHVDVVYMWQGFSHDHFGMWYYPNAKGKIHPNLQGRDHMREALDVFHRYGIKVIGYHSFADREVWLHEIDWRVVDQEGNADETINFGALCPNSPYHEYVVTRQADMLQKYPDLDGMCLIDGGSFPKSQAACYCSYCQHKHKERFGYGVPVYDGEWSEKWARYIEWKKECVAEVFTDLKQRCRYIAPEVSLSHLSFGLLSDQEGVGGNDFESIAIGDDFSNAIASWSDASWAFPSMKGDSIKRDPSAIWRCGLTTKYLRAINPHRAHVHVGRFTYDREYQMAPEHELTVATFSVLAAGGCPSLADNLLPNGSLHEKVYSFAQTLFEKVDQTKPYLPDQSEVASVALLYDKASADYRSMTNWNENRYTQSFHSAYLFLTQHHIPFQVIAKRQMTKESLKKFSVVLLNDMVALSKPFAQVLQDYVAEGGKLLCVGAIGLVNEQGKPYDDLALSALQGVSFVNPYCQPICFVSSDAVEDLILSRGNVLKVRTVDACEVKGYLVEGASTQSGRNRAVTYACDMHPGIQTQHPMVVKHAFGKGCVTTVAFDALNQFGLFRYENTRILMHSTLEELIGEDAVMQVKARRSVETTTYPFENGIRIHMINYAVDALSMVSIQGGHMSCEPLESGEVSITLFGESKMPKVCIAGEKTEIPCDCEAGMLQFTVPSFDVYRCVEITGFKPKTKTPNHSIIQP